MTTFITDINKLEATRKYRKTKLGVITNSYHKHVQRSSERGYPPPTYTLKELQALFINCPVFDSIYNNWVENAYNYYDIPSFDRVDPLLPYTLDNLQVLSWRENRKKGDLEKILTRRTQVIMCNLDGDELQMFDSTKEASIASGCNQSLITMCCQGKRRQTGGYKWKYGEKHRCKNTDIYANPELL